VRLRRDPYRDVIARQLNLFVEDEADALEECREKYRIYERAAREDAEEAYGDFVDAVETATEALADMRTRSTKTPPRCTRTPSTLPSGSVGPSSGWRSRTADGQDRGVRPAR